MSKKWYQSLTSSVRRRRMEKQFTSRIWWTSVTWRTPNLQNTSRNIQGTSCAPRAQRQRRRRIQSSIHRARCFSVSDGSGKVLGHLLKACGYGWKDAISAYIQVKMTEAPRWLPMPNKECPENVDHNSPRQRPEGCDDIEDPVVLLERHLYCHPLAGLLWERKFEKKKKWYLKRAGRKYRHWNVFSCTRSSYYSYRYLWMM